MAKRRTASWRVVLVLGAVFPLSIPGSGSAQEVDLGITGVTLIDGTGAPPRAGTTIIINDGRIIAGANTLAHAVGDDPEPGPEHIRMLVERGVSVTPTLAFFYALHRYADDPSLLDDSFLPHPCTGIATTGSWPRN